MDNLSVIFQYDTALPASCLTVSQDERAIAVAEGDTIFIEENPLFSNSIRLVGKNNGSQHKYMRFVLDSIKTNSKNKMDEMHFH